MNILIKLVNPDTRQPITGGAASTSMKIRRNPDGYLLDWSDLTFKAAGWGSLATTLAEVSATNTPGLYTLEVTTTTWTDGDYYFDATYSAAGINLYFEGATRIEDGVEAVIAGTVNDKTGYALTTADKDNIVDRMADEPFTASSHNVPTSFARRLRQLTDVVIHDGTARVGVAGVNQIQLATDASPFDGDYDPGVVTVVEGTCAGQSRRILEYRGVDRVATLDRDWRNGTPDATSKYQITPYTGSSSVNEGLLRGATANTARLNGYSSTHNGVYVGQLLFLVSGTGQDQVGLIMASDGTTQTVTISGTWAVTPDTTTGYVLLPASPVLLDALTRVQINNIESKTANLPSDPASETNVNTRASQVSVDALGDPMQTGEQVTVATNNDKTGYALTASYDLTLAAINDATVAIQERTDNLPDDPASEATVISRASQDSVDIMQADIDVLTGGAGVYAVTVQCYETDTTTPISDVAGAVYDANDDLAAVFYAEITGQAAIALDAGTYSFRLRKSGFSFAVETIIISASGTQIIYGDAVAIPAPVSADNCQIYDYCFSQDGTTPMSAVNSSARIVSLPYSYAGSLRSGAMIAGTYDANTGLLRWDMPHGATVIVSIPDVGLFGTVTIPSQTTARIYDLISG